MESNARSLLDAGKVDMALNQENMVSLSPHALRTRLELDLEWSSRAGLTRLMNWTPEVARTQGAVFFKP